MVDTNPFDDAGMGYFMRQMEIDPEEKIPLKLLNLGDGLLAEGLYEELHSRTGEEIFCKGDGIKDLSNHPLVAYEVRSESQELGILAMRMYIVYVPNIINDNKIIVRVNEMIYHGKIPSYNSDGDVTLRATEAFEEKQCSLDTPASAILELEDKVEKARRDGIREEERASLAKRLVDNNIAGGEPVYRQDPHTSIRFATNETDGHARKRMNKD